MFCSKCGNQVPDGGAFCPVCGNKIAAPAQPQYTQPQQPYAQPQYVQPQQPYAQPQQPYAQPKYVQPAPQPKPVKPAPKAAEPINLTLDFGNMSKAKLISMIGAFVFGGIMFVEGIIDFIRYIPMFRYMSGLPIINILLGTICCWGAAALLILAVFLSDNLKKLFIPIGFFALAFSSLLSFIAVAASSSYDGLTMFSLTTFIVCLCEAFIGVSFFINKPLFGQYTALSFKDLCEIMNDHPDIWIVTDSKYTDKDSITTEFSNMKAVAEELSMMSVFDRIVVQLYNEAMYSVVNEIYSFKNYIFTLYQRWTGSDMNDFESICRWSAERGIDSMTMWDYLLNGNTLS
ncbi:MAG: hypothetical protein HUJ76_12750, partial [Parasporobacterium sp.]|nr:hypothetical protein [Parasporobacterium sp.]